MIDIKTLLDNESNILIDDEDILLFEYCWCEYAWLNKKTLNQGIFKQDHKELALIIGKNLAFYGSK